MNFLFHRLGYGAVLWAVFLSGVSAKAARPDPRLQRALASLKMVSSGAELIQSARQKWILKDDFEVLDHLRWAGVSKTDRTLIREWDPSTGLEIQKSILSIWLRQNQPDGALVLDLAHELTHAVRGPAWDPYDPDLTPSKFVLASIEGNGGETDALEMECKIAHQMIRESAHRFLGVGAIDSARCERYWSGGKEPHVDREKIQSDFYRVGNWKSTLERQMSKSGKANEGDSNTELMSRLSGEAPQLYSSTGQAPYPVALLEEFQALNEKACENTTRRLRDEGRNQESVKTFLARRCSQQ